MSHDKTQKTNDVGNRGLIEVKGKGTPKKILWLIVLLVVVFITTMIVMKRLTKKLPEQTEIKKTNEAFVNDTSVGGQLTSMMTMIKEKQERQQREEAARSKAKSEKKTTPESNNEGRQSFVVQSIEANHAAQPSQSVGEDKDKPIPKPIRQLSGDTMVSMENKESQDKKQENTPKSAKDKEPEKDYLQGGTYVNGSVSPVMKRKYLLSAGTSLSCVLKTKIVTSYPGVTLCQLTKDIYSDNGEILLARAGAILMGEQNKTMKQGIARVFVNWTNLKDGNVNVRIDALGTDNLGASGQPAWIDSHFWARFGGVLLLSLVGDGLEILKSSTQSAGSNSHITYDNTSDATKEMAKTTLENTINIPPTAYINQGTVLSVIVPRNIDFSSVFEVR